MGWKKLNFRGEDADKDDPKYEKRYKKEVEAGKKAARFLRIDKMQGVRNDLPASIRDGFSVSCSASCWDASHSMCAGWYQYAPCLTMANKPQPPSGRRFF